MRSYRLVTEHSLASVANEADAEGPRCNFAWLTFKYSSRLIAVVASEFNVENAFQRGAWIVEMEGYWLDIGYVGEGRWSTGRDGWGGPLKHKIKKGP